MNSLSRQRSNKSGMLARSLLGHHAIYHGLYGDLFQKEKMVSVKTGITICKISKNI
jgi:hypothetical protein